MSVVLVGPNGQTWAKQRTHVLMDAQVAWLIDGPSLIRHVAHLDQLGAQIQCRRCHQEPSIRKSFGQRVTFHCCRTGWIDLAKPSEVAPLLQALDWTLVCPRCSEPLSGDNAPGGLVYEVRCPCTTRVYHVPPQGLVS